MNLLAPANAVAVMLSCGSKGGCRFDGRVRYLEGPSVETYLRRSGRVAADQRIDVRELSGGVSNVVFHVRVEAEADRQFILKQSRPRLRVHEPWYCDVGRIFREIDVLKVCRDVLGPVNTTSLQPADSLSADVPHVLFEDRDNYLFAMSVAPSPHVTWKQQLLDDHVELPVAQAASKMLAELHRVTWDNAELARRLGDKQFFRDLRTEPYFAQLLGKHADLAGQLSALCDSLMTQTLSLVHGDFSPKNVLVHSRGITLVDMEVGHFGDPAFDVGFMMSHLVLKALRGAQLRVACLEAADVFWHAYFDALPAGTGDRQPTVPPDAIQLLAGRALQVLAACMLARVDGKSPVDYLDDAPSVRRCARGLVQAQPPTWEDFRKLMLSMIHAA